MAHEPEDVEVKDIDGHAIRAVTRQGKPWHVLPDACRIAGQDPTGAARKVPAAEQGKARIRTNGVVRVIGVVNADGLRRIIGAHSPRRKAKAHAAASLALARQSDEEAQPLSISLATFGAHMFEGYAIRAGADTAEPWLCIKDLCVPIDIVDHHTALRRVSPANKGVHSMPTLGGTQTMLMVNEAGFNEIIATSRKPAAIHLRHWLTQDVLPKLRQGGSYTMPGAATVPADPGDLPATHKDIGLLSTSILMVHKQMEILQAAMGPMTRLLQKIEADAAAHRARALGNGNAMGVAGSAPLNAAIRLLLQESRQLQRQAAPDGICKEEQAAYEAIMRLGWSLSHTEADKWRDACTIETVFKDWLATIEEGETVAQMLAILASTWLNARASRGVAGLFGCKTETGALLFHGEDMRTWLICAGLPYVRNVEATAWPTGVPIQAAIA